jgi:PAS domain S-box-containing protein
MKDEDKTKKHLIRELTELRKQVAEFERSDANRKQITKILQKEKDELQTILDSSPLIIWCKDKDGKILFANKYAAKTFGCSVEDILNKCCYDFHPKKEADKFRKDDLAVINSGKPEYGIIEKYVVPSGEQRWALTNKIPYHDEEGNVIGVVVFVMDINEQKRTEETLLKTHNDMEICLNELTSNMISVNKKLRYEIIERKRAEEGLVKSQKLLRDLNRRLEFIREEERKNIALEMHDELGQTLTALRLDVSWLSKRMPKEQKFFSEKIEEMANSISEMIHSVQKISSELRPVVLDDLGIIAAIEWQVNKFQERAGIKCNISFDSEDMLLNWEISTAFFRILQECLTNIARHANATEVRVDFKEKDGTVTLRVSDNGRGITEEQISDPTSFGLLGIRERLYPLGGRLKIEGAKGTGTTITVSISVMRHSELCNVLERFGNPTAYE